MASNNVLGDEESQLSGGTNRVQPFSSTPKKTNYDDERKKPASLSLSQRLGIPDFFSMDVWRASIGELLGSAVLVFMLDTIVISTIESDTKMPNLIMSILIAIVVTTYYWQLFRCPEATSTLLSPSQLGSSELYLCQEPSFTWWHKCVGAILGALALKVVVSSSIEQNFSLGGCTITEIAPGPNGPVTVGLETAQALLLEIFCTFVFLFASIWMAYDHRQAKALGHVTVLSIVGLVLGLLVFISTTVTAKRGYAGAGMNPTRFFGAAIVRGGHLWDGHWIFWVGPTIGCVAFYGYTKTIPPNHFQAEYGYKHDFLGVVKALFGWDV